jgi:hypothetical protein
MDTIVTIKISNIIYVIVVTLLHRIIMRAAHSSLLALTAFPREML